MHIANILYSLGWMIVINLVILSHVAKSWPLTGVVLQFCRCLISHFLSSHPTNDQSKSLGIETLMQPSMTVVVLESDFHHVANVGGGLSHGFKTHWVLL